MTDRAQSNVGFAPEATIPQMARWANRRHEPARKRLAIKSPDIRLQIIRPQQCSNHLAARYSRALISSGRVLLRSAISSARLK